MSFGQQEGRIAALHTFMSAQFPGSQLAERHGGRIDYALSSKPGEALRIAEVFGKVEAAKLELSVEEYSSAKTSGLAIKLVEETDVRFCSAQGHAELA